jgi:hypothetical protein
MASHIYISLSLTSGKYFAEESIQIGRGGRNYQPELDLSAAEEISASFAESKSATAVQT